MKIINQILVVIFFITSYAFAQGPQWRVYLPQNSGLPGLPVSSLAFDKSENCIWMGVKGTVTKFNWLNWIVYDTANSPLLYTGYVTIAIDSNNNKWIGSIIGGVFRFDGINWTIYNTSNSPLPGNWIGDIFVDVIDVKWIGTAFGGLAKLEDTTWTIYNTQNSNIPQNLIRAGISENHIKWIGTDDRGIGKFNDTTWITYNSTNSGLSFDNVSDIDMDTSGNKWISSRGGGLNKFNSVDSIWSNYLNGGYITCLEIDKFGNKWLGSPGGGLYKFYNDSGLINYRPENSPMPSYTVNALSLDSNGNLWIATNGGLAVFNENGIVGINDPEIINVPTDSKLYQNFPNPFNPDTKIRYDIIFNTNAKITLFDVTGKTVNILLNEFKNPGSYQIIFNGNKLSSGVYFYRLETKNSDITKAMLLVK